VLAGFRLLQVSKAFIRKSGVFRFINNPVKNYPKSGLIMVVFLNVRCNSSAKYLRMLNTLCGGASDWNV